MRVPRSGPLGASWSDTHAPAKPSELLSLLFPHLALLHINANSVLGATLQMSVCCAAPTASCSGCGAVEPCTQPLSAHRRRCGGRGQNTVIELTVRRFFCDDGTYPKTTFAEQVPQLTFRPMWCACFFAALEMLNLPDVIRGGVSSIVTWVAQTFLQLVLLSVIMVSQNVQADAADKRAEAIYQEVCAAIHGQSQIAEHLVKQDAVLLSIQAKLGELAPR